MHSIVNIILIIIFDLVWLNLQKQNYDSVIKTIQGKKIDIRIAGAILAYIFMFIGLKYIIYPAKDILKTSTIFGFVVYGIYNATNYAIFKNYSLNIAIKDTLWGTFVFYITTWITLKLFRKFKID